MIKTRSCLEYFLGFIFLCLLIVALAWKPYFLKPSSVNACTLDSDCIMVPPIGCGYPSSINKSNLELWNLHQNLRKFPPIIGACSPSPPVDAFQPFCLQNACRAVLIHDHAILEFSQPPVLGQPTDLIFRFRTSSGLENERAKIEFTPALVTLHSGDLTWQGSLTPDTEQQMRLSVTFPKPGYYHIHGDAPAGQGHRQQDDVYFLLSSKGIQYGKRPINQWDISHLAYPLGEEDDRLFRELTFDPAPALDRKTTVVYRIRSTIDLTSADMQIVLPPGGFEVIDVTYPAGGERGQSTIPLQLWWRGPVRADETLEIHATVKVTKPGWGLAYGELRSAELPENVIYAFVYIDEYNGYHEIRESP